MSASQRRLWNTFSGHAASVAAATSSRPPAASGANGLSAIVGTPAAIACRTSARRVRGGVVMVTASTPAGQQIGERVVGGHAGEVRGQLGAPVRRARHHPGQLDALGRGDERRVEVPPADPVPDQSQSHVSYTFAAAARRFSAASARPSSRP